MVSKVDISIIIPTYNEKNYLWDSVNRIKKVFKNLYNYEIIFVDSNSDDGSKNIFEAIKKENKNVKIIYQSCKKGIGSASFEGYLGSDGDFIMQIDGDCSHDPNDLLEMYKKIKNENYDMVIGSRYIEGGEQLGKSILRDYGSRIMNIFASYLLDIKQKDFTHTFRCFRKKIFYKLKDQLTETGHPSFFIQLTFLSLKENYKISEIPITYDSTSSKDQSRINVFKELPKYLFLVLKLFVKKKIKNKTI